jgi:hypothetical protein
MHGTCGVIFCHNIDANSGIIIDVEYWEMAMGHQIENCLLK